MKVLYAIQTTGNGHISRAKEFIPHLERRFQFDILLSGPKTQLDLGYPVKYHFRGLTLHYTPSGAVNWGKTLLKNNFIQFIKDCFSLRVEAYDLVITDFEPISAWSSKLKGVLCFGMSNQISLWQKNVPKPKKKHRAAIRYLKYFAPSKKEYGLHYQKFSPHIFSPIIRSSVRALECQQGGGVLVYLPAYDIKNIYEVTQRYPSTTWHVFSDDVSGPYQNGNTFFYPVDEMAFLDRFAKADGVVSNAGFTTTSEALYLEKPLLVVPMRGQIEQRYNAAALRQMGVTILKSFDVAATSKINNWLENPNRIKADFDNELGVLVDQMAIDYIKIKFNTDSYFTTS